jgi:hypothetical protein
MSCVDTDRDLVVVSDSQPHRTNHLLTFPRACELPLFDTDISCHTIAGDIYPHRTSRLLTSPRACEITPCKITIPHYGSHDVRHDGDIDDDLPITIDAIA